MPKFPSASGLQAVSEKQRRVLTDPDAINRPHDRQRLIVDLEKTMMDLFRWAEIEFILRVSQ